MILLFIVKDTGKNHQTLGKEKKFQFWTFWGKASFKYVLEAKFAQHSTYQQILWEKVFQRNPIFSWVGAQSPILRRSNFNRQSIKKGSKKDIGCDGWGLFIIGASPISLNSKYSNRILTDSGKQSKTTNKWNSVAAWASKSLKSCPKGLQRCFTNFQNYGIIWVVINKICIDVRDLGKKIFDQQYFENKIEYFY